MTKDFQISRLKEKITKFNKKEYEYTREIYDLTEENKELQNLLRLMLAILIYMWAYLFIYTRDEKILNKH